MTYYWLSFCDSDRPEGQHFLGGCIVEAWNAEDAVREAWAQNCNPGGEVAIIEVTPQYEANVAKFTINHLYTRAEIEAMGEYRSLQDAIASGDVTDG